MNFEEAGTGEPIVLVHGGGLDLRSWCEVMPLLAAHHRTIAADLRYFGPPTGRTTDRTSVSRPMPMTSPTSSH